MNQNSKSIVCGRFQLLSRLNHGSFGQIFKGVEISSGVKVAVKIEKIQDDNPTLRREAQIISLLYGIPGVPTLYGFEKIRKNYIMVMDLLGPNLSTLCYRIGKPFSLKTTLMIADQLLTRLEAVHLKGVLHRDIKPENIVFGKNRDSNKIFLIDYGLAKMYLDENGDHIPPKNGKSLVGTARFASLNTHLGFEQGRRDDLESLIYTLIYLIKFDLPWKNPPTDATKEMKYQYIKETKQNVSIKEITKDLPSEFEVFLKYVRDLGFDDAPNYKYLKGLFRRLFIKNSFEFDFVYDWVTTEKRKHADKKNTGNDNLGKQEIRLTGPFKPHFNTNHGLGHYQRKQSSDNFSISDDECKDNKEIIIKCYRKIDQNNSSLSVRRGKSEYIIQYEIKPQEIKLPENIYPAHSKPSKIGLLPSKSKSSLVINTRSVSNDANEFQSPQPKKTFDMNPIQEAFESSKSLEFDSNDDEYKAEEENIRTKYCLLNSHKTQFEFIEKVNNKNFKESVAKTNEQIESK